jgi:hypothetical protein
LDLCEELSAWSEKGLFRHAALPLLVRRTALRLRRQEFHESVATYEQLVAWLRGAELPNANPNSNHNLNLNHHPNHNSSSSSSAVPGDVEAERAERAARAERAGVGAAETALLALRAQPSAALARETAALAAELGDEQLMRAASALLHSQRHNNTDAANRDNHTDAAANRANNTDADPELRAALLAATAPQTDLLLRALEQRDAAFFLQ